MCVYVCVSEIAEGTGRRAECRLAVMLSKYLEQRQEVIMGKSCCSLPVMTSLTLRVFGAGSVTGHTV